MQNFKLDPDQIVPEIIVGLIIIGTLILLYNAIKELLKK